MRSRTDGVSTGGARAEELAAAGAAEMEEPAAAWREEGATAADGGAGEDWVARCPRRAWEAAALGRFC